MTIPKPGPDEYPAHVAYEIEPAPYNDLLPGLEASCQALVAFLQSLPEEELAYRYAPGKWSIRQIWQHITDAERIMSYRALCFARQDATHLPGFEENDYAVTAQADARPMADILAEYRAVRKASIELFKSFTPQMLDRRGTGGPSILSVRALGYFLIGHETHHARIIRERYLNKEYAAG